MPGVWVDVTRGRLVPDGLGAAARVDDGGGAGPPDLVVRSDGDLADSGARESTSGGEVGVWGEAALWFDSAEVLNVPPLGPTQVLPEPVEECGEMHGVPGRAAIVVGVRVERRA